MKKIKITWEDAVLYGAKSKMPTKISTMEVIGFFEKENNDWIILKDPQNINIETRKKHPVNIDPTFYCIPKKTIKKIEELN